MKKIFSVLTIAIVSVFINTGFSGETRNIFNLDAEILNELDINFPFQTPQPTVSGERKEPEVSSEAEGLVHGFTPQQKREMLRHNEALLMSGSKGIAFRIELGSVIPSLQYKYRPYADYEKTGYLIMSAGFEFKSRPAKLEMAKNLPSDAFLVIFINDASLSVKDAVFKDYADVLPEERIKVISLPNASDGFWARDGIPVPVLDETNKLTVIDARYYRFEPDAEISRIFGTGIESHEYYFEGGGIFRPIIRAIA